jgi:hypothetical protein
MKTLKIATALVVGSAALLAAAPAQADKRENCYPRGTTTSIATADARVYEVGLSDNQRIYACLFSTGKSRPLGRFQTDFGISNEALSGRFVAYQYLDCREDCSRSEVRVLDLKTGAKRKSPKAGTGSGGITGLVVKRNGSAAWIREVGRSYGEVHTFTASGESVLDSGAGIEPFSLALAGSRLYWTKDGLAATALFD